MKKFYIPVQIAIICVCLFSQEDVKAQCASLTATCITYESRCAATGAIKVMALGGSGNYKYKTTGPVNTNFTTSDSITGLSAGIYTVTVNDVVSNCNFSITNVVVAGTYQDPRFTLSKIDVSCDNSNNGSITVDSYSFGRAPFLYSIVAPSPMGVGTTNSSGVFTNLTTGNYSIRMTDSCGGIQTRQVTIINYTWWIDAVSFTKTACDEASGFIKVVDSRGNISTVGGIPGFIYGIVRSVGDTIWSSNPNFTFALLGHSTFEVIAKDNCGIIKKANSSVSLAATVAANVNSFGYLCNSFSASLTVGINFLTPDFCLFDSSNTLLNCNTTGVFSGLPYGSYCIKAHDSCTDTSITRCFTMAAPPISVNNNILIIDKTCTSFTAIVTGQVGLTSPDYCLYDSTNTLIICNITGIFPGLSYQPYCITIKDGCRDTTLTRCFDPHPPIPIIPGTLNPYYVTCTNFGIQVGGDSLTAPLYCLYDSIGVLIICNNTGVFDSIPLGNYCITIYDSCYDTTFTRCIDVFPPVIQNDMITSIRPQNCSEFTVTVSSQNIDNPLYCLYDSSDVLIICDSTGTFSNIPYGTYCIKAAVACPDTTLISCFTAYPPLPALGASVNISNLSCNSFSAAIQNQQNITNPTYCLYDSSNVLVSCNITGSFNNLPYGMYCIKMTDGCYDTVITRCFVQSPIKVSISGNAVKSCSFGWVSFNLNTGSYNGYLPVNITIYNPDGSLFSNSNYNSNSIVIDSIPGVASGLFYNIIATDQCGNRDSIKLGSVASYFTHSPSIVPKCPSAIWSNGSGDILTTVLTNMGTLNVKLIKKNGISLFPSISANTVINGVYTFIDLGPGTYIIRSGANSCSEKKYDTVVISNYEYPNLDRSSAYQCDVNGFSIIAVATNGVGPFSYEIIGSQPTTPDITTSPQTSPIFTINNGSNYSLVRLRALDACGNATLGDASILPLALNGAVSTLNCLSQPTTLMVDSIYNSSYAWYKKLTENSTDSTLIGTGTSYFIPTVLPSDTGIYVCYVTVNSGCINRTFIFHIDGQCWIVLPVILAEFKGQHMDEKNLLTWKTTQEETLSYFIVERKNNYGDFVEIGRINAFGNSTTIQAYRFYDMSPLKGKNKYRLKMVKIDHSFSYSNIIQLGGNYNLPIVTIYPNPVTTKFEINFNNETRHHFNIRLFTSTGEMLREFKYSGEGNKLEVQRPIDMQKGIYILQLLDLDTNQLYKEKLIFL